MHINGRKINSDWSYFGEIGVLESVSFLIKTKLLFNFESLQSLDFYTRSRPEGAVRNSRGALITNGTAENKV
jgi:hypothetical protein